jgi:hypothetical protein
MSDDFNDELDDLIGAVKRAEMPKAPGPFLPAKAEQRNFVEPCMACRGTGKWRGFRPCFKCDGTGKKTFKTSPEARGKARMRAEEKRELKAEQDAQWRVDHVTELAWLARAANINQQRGGTFDFPQKLLDAIAQYGTLTDGQLAAVHKLMLRDAERQQQRADARTTKLDTAKIEAAFATARHNAARPGMQGVWMKPLKLRALNVDVAFQPGSIGSQWEGQIFVKSGEKKLGTVKPGAFTARFECTDAERDAVVHAIENPMGAARAFGKAWGVCTVCGRTLTDDTSIANGIGPICAENFGW